MKFWDLIARLYDPLVYTLLGRAYRSMEHWAPCQVPAGCSILELGAGTGALTLPLAKGARRYVATDSSWQMLVQLRRKLQRAGEYAVETRQLDAAGKLPEGPFDVVVAANILHLLDEPRETLRAALGELTPGGLLLAPTFLHGGSLFARVARWFGFPVRHRLTLEGLLQMLRESGFEPLPYRVVPGLVPLALVSARRAICAEEPAAAAADAPARPAPRPL